MRLIEINKIAEASEKISALVRATECQKSNYFSKLFNTNVFFKREDQQKIKSFKIRGAYNKILSLDNTDLNKGLVCASAGNHAQGFALSCSHLNKRGTVFIPKSAPQLKIDRVSQFGGKFVDINIHGLNFYDAYDEAKIFTKKNNMVFIHPFDDIKVITGQATIFLEIVNQIKDKLDFLFIPIGGGGLIAGALNVFKQLSPKTKIIGIEPLGAPSMFESLKKNKLITLEKIDRFVDGIAVKKVGNISFNYCKEFLDDIVILDENEICYSIIELLETENIVAEPAGAMSTAALSHYKHKIFGKNVACIICGGNNDVSRMPEIRRRANKWVKTRKN